MDTMKKHTETKQAKIYGIPVLAVVALAALAVLAKWGGEKGLVVGALVTAAFFGGSALILADAFRRQLRYDLYSYNTILYAGFSLFLLSLFGAHAYVAVQACLHPADFHAMQMVYTLLHSAKNYMLLTAPLLILFSGALFVSNVSLIRHEGLRVVNLLGIFLAVILVAGEIVVAILDFRSAFSTNARLLRNMIVNMAAALYLYFECMIVGAATADVIAARQIPEKDKDALIVLGCGLKKDGTPTPLLRGRLELALAFDREQQAQSGKLARYVVSGGQGPDEVQSEAASMREYLLTQGIAPERILMEDQSTDTEENMRFSRAVLEQHSPSARAAFFTTNYHVFRSGLKARAAGLRADGMGAQTRWYFWPNAAVREFVGLLTEHKGKQAFVLLLLLTVYAALTVLIYA